MCTPPPSAVDRARWQKDCSREVHRLRLFEPAEIVAALTAAGFEVKTSNGFGRCRLGTGLTAFVARKRGIFN